MENAQTGERSIEDEVVGFEDDVESIMQQLNGRANELGIVSIVGMPGLGKTTLARKVFKRFANSNRFDVQAWCSISKEYSLRKVFPDILKQVIGNLDGINENDMPDKLRKSLMRKRYLVVLDDVWDVNVWEELRLSFPQNVDGSRILVTTRDEEVALQLGNPYFLRFLTVDESWELLKKKVFQGDIGSQELLEAGFQIAKSCKGLPLVIVLTAGIIGQKREVSFWKEVASGLSTHVLEEQSMKMIELSYDHLEEHLKPCLLYMGLYPEDYRIPTSDILKLWIAENFVHDLENHEEEEVSKICLSDLVKKSLVMVSKKGGNGEIKYCILHDVVREFCLIKIKKEKFVQFIVPYNPYKPSDATEVPRNCVYVHDDLVKQLARNESSLDESSSAPCHWSSLEFIAHPKFYAWDQMSLLRLIDRFRLIRALHLMDFRLEGCSWGAAMLAVPHLKYLAIQTDHFDFQWVSHLLDLQTLQVRCGLGVTMSPCVWKMQKLRHMDMSASFRLTVENDNEAIFGRSTAVLPNVKTLRECYINLGFEINPKLWQSFPNVEELSLRFFGRASKFQMVNVVGNYMQPLQELPLQTLELVFNCERIKDWSGVVVFPSSLKDLTLHEIFLAQEVVSNIAQLQNLERLTLYHTYCNNGEGGECWDVKDYQFPALKYLKLISVDDIVKWESSEESFPVLEKLVIRQCFLLEEIPSSFVDVPTLKLIKLIASSRKILVDSALNIKKEVEEMTGCDTLQVRVFDRLY